jgi:hypothetical protein
MTAKVAFWELISAFNLIDHVNLTGAFPAIFAPEREYVTAVATPIRAHV